MTIIKSEVIRHSEKNSWKIHNRYDMIVLGIGVMYFVLLSSVLEPKWVARKDNCMRRIFNI